MISKEQYDADNRKINLALEFANRKHSAVVNKDGTMGQRRKGSRLPYIIHPLEVWMILRNNNCSADVQVAGLLHDTLEDTGATPDEIEKLFGREVRELVVTESEDKSKSWKERKQHTIDSMVGASLETMQVCCADKLANCRSQAYDFRLIGDRLFERFNREATPELQSWYYHGVVKALKPLEGMKMYDELKEVVRQVYGE